MISKLIWGEKFRNPVPTFSMIGSWYKSLGFSQIAVSGSAIGLGVIPENVIMTLVTVDGGDVRFRDDGTNPTASIGMRVERGGALKYDADPSVLKFINTSAAATLNITFYGMGGIDA